MDLERRVVIGLPEQGRATSRGTADVATVLEAYVERVARLVLHSASLAERLEQRRHEQGVVGRLDALRDAVTRGERAIVGTVQQHAGAGAQERRSGGDRRVALRA